MSVSPKKLLRPELSKLQAYQVPESEGFVKLDAMENPYALPDEIQQQWQQALGEVSLHRYPEPQANQLKQSFRDTFSISSSLEIMFGNGSDELIQLLLLAIAKPNTCALTVTPSFSMYTLIAEYIGVQVIEVPLMENAFDLPMSSLQTAIQQHHPALIFLACPNNPTGTLWPMELVEQIVQQATGLVVIDEAYAPFAAYSMLPIVEKYSHALMLRTVSKMGLAGLRLGWLLGDKQWLDEFNKIRLPYNINVLTQISAKFALQNIDIFNKQAAMICEQREMLIQAMQEVSEIQVFPSQANFIMFKTLSKQADQVFQKLLDQNIMIKNVADNNLLENCLRVTVGTAQENEAFVTALKTSVV